VPLMAVNGDQTCVGCTLGVSYLTTDLVCPNAEALDSPSGLKLKVRMSKLREHVTALQDSLRYMCATGSEADHRGTTLTPSGTN
jgi:hypothetical protein